MTETKSGVNILFWRHAFCTTILGGTVDGVFITQQPKMYGHQPFFTTTFISFEIRKLNYPSTLTRARSTPVSKTRLFVVGGGVHSISDMWPLTAD